MGSASHPVSIRDPCIAATGVGQSHHCGRPGCRPVSSGQGHYVWLLRTQGLWLMTRPGQTGRSGLPSSKANTGEGAETMKATSGPGHTAPPAPPACSRSSICGHVCWGAEVFSGPSSVTGLLRGQPWSWEELAQRAKLSCLLHQPGCNGHDRQGPGMEADDC
jgi:hypothetical protein